MFGADPYTKTIDASEALNFLKGEDVDDDILRRFALEILDVYETAECESCGFEVPAVEIDDTLTCMLCKTSLTRTFNVSFSFSIDVKAANRDAAEVLAENAVSVNVDEDQFISDNYDLELQDVSEQF